MLKAEDQQLEERAEQALRTCITDVSFLKVIEIDRKAGPVGQSPDLRAVVEVSGRPRVLIVEVEASGQPRIARIAVNQLLRHMAVTPGAYAVFIAPYISEAAASICTRDGVGYLDFAGNCQLAFDQVYINRSGAPNPFRQKRDLQSLYTPKSERILRTLLTHPSRPWRIQELAEESVVSLGQVANVKKLLLDREWVKAGSEGLALAEQEALLTEWARQYAPRQERARDYYSLRTVNEVEYDLSEACRESGVRCALTGLSGVARYAAFVRYQRVTAYIDAVSEDLIRRLALKPVTSGANVTLIAPYDEGVYYAAETFAGVPVVSPVQVYLDLQRVQGRGEEAAGALLKEVIEPRWRRAE